METCVSSMYTCRLPSHHSMDTQTCSPYLSGTGPPEKSVTKKHHTYCTLTHICVVDSFTSIKKAYQSFSKYSEFFCSVYTQINIKHCNLTQSNFWSSKQKLKYTSIHCINNWFRFRLWWYSIIRIELHRVRVEGFVQMGIGKQSNIEIRYMPWP